MLKIEFTFLKIKICYEMIQNIKIFTKIEKYFKKK